MLGKSRHDRLHNTILAALIVLATAAAGQAQSGDGARSAHPGFDIRVVIPAIVRVKAFIQPATLEVSVRDVARGYVDLDGASSLLLTSNSGRGYQLSVAFDASLLDNVEVTIAGDRRAVRDTQQSLHIDAPRAVDAPVRIGYRLFLKKLVVPGVYRWPVSVAFSAASA